MESSKKILAIIIICIITGAGATTGIITYLMSQPNNTPAVNNPPVIDGFYPLNDPLISETQSQVFNVSASDLDNTSLTYSWYLDDSAVLGNITSYMFTSNYDSSGTYEVRAEATDGEFTCNHTWILTIFDVNRPPLISSLPNQTLAEDSSTLNAFDLDDYASDPDGDPLNYTISENTNPNCGVSIDTNNSIDISPIPNWHGISNITIQATDGELNASESFMINVTSVNDPLVIADFFPQYLPIINETETQEFNITISNPDPTILTYSWTLNGSSVGTNSSSYTFDANYNSNGIYLVKVHITDGEDTIEYYWILTVSNINRAPSLDGYSPLGNPIINELESQEFNISVSDPDGDLLTYSWYVDGVSVGLNEGNYTYTTDYGSAGVHVVKVNVTDGQYTVEKLWMLTVNDVNRAPSMTSTSPSSATPSINENEIQDFEIETFDPDNDPLIVMWYVDGGLVKISGNYTFTSDYDSAGVYIVKVNITDGEYVDEYTWMLTVNDVNRAPQITFTSPASSTPTIDETQGQDFEIVASDPDGDPLTIRWYVDGSLVKTGGNYTFTTDYDSAGVYTIKVNAIDGELVDENSWILTVNNVNRAPVADIVNDDIVSNVGWFVKFNGSDSTDPDGESDIDTYLWDFGDGSFGTGKTTNHSYSVPGDYTVELTVNDSANANSQDEVNVTVQDYFEEDLEGGHATHFGNNERIAQIFPINDPLYIYNISIFVAFVNLFDTVYANLTLEIRGIDVFIDPNDTVYETVFMPNIHEILNQESGWINLTIDSHYLVDDVYIVTLIENWGGNSYYALGADGSNDLITKKDTGSSWTSQTADQTMNIIYLWANTTSDVNSPPQVRIINDDVVSNVDWKVMFDASDSWDANGLSDIDTYLWDFGDGNVGYGMEVNHTYTTAGKYKAVLTVNDTFNVESSDWVWVEVQDYIEVEIESKNTHTVGRTDKVAQRLDVSSSNFGSPFYLYNVTIYIIKLNADPVTANLTLELQGLDWIGKPNGTVLYSKIITDISEGWINIPINGYYVADKIYVVTYIDNSVSFSYYSVAHNGQANNDELTLVDSGSGFSDFGIDWDQAMNATLQWANTTFDVVQNSFGLSIPSLIPFSLFGYNITLYILVYVLGFAEFFIIIKRFKKISNAHVRSLFKTIF